MPFVVCVFTKRKIECTLIHMYTYKHRHYLVRTDLEELLHLESSRTRESKSFIVNKALEAYFAVLKKRR